MEHGWNEIDREKRKYSGKNLSQCHFVHHRVEQLLHNDWVAKIPSVRRKCHLKVTSFIKQERPYTQNSIRNKDC
jgi:hypothetical protein